MAVAIERHTNRRTLVAFYAAGLRAGSARFVRGCSRRMTTMRCRPAYIRVINRRKRFRAQPYLAEQGTIRARPSFGTTRGIEWLRDSAARRKSCLNAAAVREIGRVGP